MMLRINKLKMSFLCLGILLIAAGAGAQDNSTVVVRPTPAPVSVVIVVDGRVVELETAELVRSQQVMVGLRDLEKAGWGTVVSGSAEQAIFQGKNTTLTFNKGQDVAMVNSLSVRLPINTYTKSSRLMVPLSFVAKALGYDYDCSFRPVAMVITSPAKVIKKTNELRGGVMYNGRGIRGIKVRVTDGEFRTIKGFEAITDAKGDYVIDGLPDGTYMTYVYIKDNPAFFNRSSEKAALVEGSTAQLRPIVLGAVISPISPKIDGLVMSQSGKVRFAWTSCDGAASYKLTVREQGTRKTALEATAERSTVQISAKRFTAGVRYEVELTAQDSHKGFLGSTAGSGGKPWTFVMLKSTAVEPGRPASAAPSTRRK